MSDKFVGFACLHQMVLVQYLLTQLVKIKKIKYHAPRKEKSATKQRGVGA